MGQFFPPDDVLLPKAVLPPEVELPEDVVPPNDELVEVPVLPDEPARPHALAEPLGILISLPLPIAPKNAPDPGAITLSLALPIAGSLTMAASAEVIVAESVVVVSAALPQPARPSASIPAKPYLALAKRDGLLLALTADKRWRALAEAAGVTVVVVTG